MVTPHVTRYERVEIDGETYMVCAECRRPHRPGYGVCYNVAQPGEKHATPGVSNGQSLCRDCYYMQWRRLYPGEPLPKLEPNLLEGAEPVPWNGLQLGASTEDIAAQKKALDIEQLEALAAKRRFDAEETERQLRELKGAGYDIGETTVAYRE